MVNGILELKEENESICKGCALGKNVKKPFRNNTTISQESMDPEMKSNKYI